MNIIMRLLTVFVVTFLLCLIVLRRIDISSIVAFPISLTAVAIWWFLKRKKQNREWEKFGLNLLSADEAEAYREEMNSGNRSAAIQIHEKALDRYRDALHQSGIDPDRIIPHIGTDIEWNDIVQQVFRVLEFDRNDTTVLSDGTVKAASSNLPYGYLLVESPILNVRARLPICHCDDFFLATTVFDEPELVDLVSKEELLVTYFPEPSVVFDNYCCL